MSMLRYDLENESETPQLLEISLLNRFAAGQQLVADGEWDTGIYVLGYVAEMILKYAYFRIDGASLNASTHSLLAPARAKGKQLVPNISDESYYSLTFWAELIRERRRRQGRAIASHIDLQFSNCYRRLYNQWWVEMRYHPNRATSDDAFEVLQDVAWLLNNRTFLWS